MLVVRIMKREFKPNKPSDASQPRSSAAPPIADPTAVLEAPRIPQRGGKRKNLLLFLSLLALVGFFVFLILASLALVMP